MAISDLIDQLVNRKSAPSGFEWIADSEGINFVLPRDKLALLEEGDGDEWTLTQYLQLRMLEEEGLSEALPDGFLIPTELAVQLDDEVRRLLELPSPFPGYFKTEMHGLSTHADFNLKLLPSLSDAKIFNAYTIKGPLLHITETTQYLLTPPELIAFAALEHHRGTKGLRDDEQRNLTLLAALQRAKKHGMEVELAAFDTIDIISPEKVSLILERQEDGSLLLFPNYGDSSLTDEIAKRLGQLNPHSTVGSLRVGDKRIVLDEERFRATQEILNNRSVAPEQAQSFIKNPAAFLDATLIDLDEAFSARVQGVIEFQKHYFGETDESEIDWFSTPAEPEPTTIEPNSLGTLIKTLKQLEEFQDAYEIAIEDGQSTLDFKSATVDLSNRAAIDTALDKIAEELIDTTGKTLPKPTLDDSKPQLVVDVALNDDTVDFSSELNKRVEDVLYKDEIDWSCYQKEPYSYQKRGIRWLLGLACHTFKLPEDELSKYGALLADDMGLGKTFMTLVSIAEYLKQGQVKDDKSRPVLVVAPLSLLDNWEKETDETYLPASSPFDEIIKLQADGDLVRFKATPQTIQLASNDENDQASVRKVLKVGSDYGPDRLDQPRRLVLTTYETLRDYQISLCRVDWSLVVFDEAQMVKNPNTLASRAAKGLKAHFKLMVTGTPVENSLRDFWNLLDTAQPGHLDAYQQFNREFIRPINRAEKEDRETKRQETGLALRAKVGALMLRRNKADELEGLPRKTIYCGVEDDPNAQFHLPLQCTMTSKQAAVYDMVVANVNEQAASDGNGNPFLAGLHQLRSVALHPQLLDGGILPTPQSVSEAEQLISESSKLVCVLSLLRSIREKDEKVIIFAITKQLQVFIAAACEQLFGVRGYIVNGDTKAIARSSGKLTRRKMIDSFESEPGFGVIVMSPIAAGVGLTITAANHVIHLERHWNPAKEAQATDRVYRIGQQKDVFVYLPVLHHPNSELTTFDQNLNRLLNKKSALKDAVVTPEDVQPDDITKDVFKSDSSKKEIGLSASDIDTLGWERFEAFCAVLMGKVYDAQTQLTPKSADQGCDVVLRGEINALIQCKFSEHTGRVYESEDIVREIDWARTPYESALGEAFNNLFAISNVKGFGQRVKRSSSQADVKLVDHRQLVKWLKKYPVTLNEVQQKLSKERISIN